MKVIAEVNQQYPVRATAGARSASANTAADARSNLRLNDAVELSAAAQRELSGTDEPRTELVQRIRAEIQDGTYLTDEKLNATVDRLAKALRLG